MKLIDLTCSRCGAQLKVNKDLKKCMCQYCGNEMHFSQDKTAKKKQLTDEEYNKLYLLSIATAIISIIPVFSFYFSIILLCIVIPVENTNKLKARIIVICSIALIICTISTVMFAAAVQ